MLIVAANTVQVCNDKQQVEPMLEQLGALPVELGKPDNLPDSLLGIILVTPLVFLFQNQHPLIFSSVICLHHSAPLDIRNGLYLLNLPCCLQVDLILAAVINGQLLA